MICPKCGEGMSGDGYTTPLICPNKETDEALEPDCNPRLCEE